MMRRARRTGLPESGTRPVGVTIVAAVNAVGWAATLGFWAVAHSRGTLPAVADASTYWEAAYFGTIRGFLVADSVWSNLILVLAVIGLWRVRPWGWAAAMMANSIWLYSMTVTVVRDIATVPTPGMLLFVPFTLFAAGSTVYLWAVRWTFWSHSRAGGRP